MRGEDLASYGISSQGPCGKACLLVPRDLWSAWHQGREIQKGEAYINSDLEQEDYPQQRNKTNYTDRIVSSAGTHFFPTSLMLKKRKLGGPDRLNKELTTLLPIQKLVRKVARWVSPWLFVTLWHRDMKREFSRVANRCKQTTLAQYQRWPKKDGQNH